MSSMKRITTVDSSTSFDKVFVNDKDAIKQVSKLDFLTNGGIAKATDMEQAKSDISALEADFNDLDERVSDLEAGGSGGSGGSAAPMESITWAELKAKRDDGNLTPGMQYRITDYVCTTTQEETRAVSHPYDIIVTADSANALNESARACLHDGDDYYSAEGHSANLKAWELKYCLDNDTSRFAWVDETNGKGVVYYLKDEKGNECPYDFKQIQFKRYLITECEKVPSLVGGATALIHSSVITGIDEDNPVWCYTFSNFQENLEDATVLDYCIVLENTIAPFYDDNQMSLNNIVFNISLDCHGNTFGNNCHSNTFMECHDNTFGNNCYANIFDQGGHSNTFGNGCYGNVFYRNSHNNIFGDNCNSNAFDSNCYENIFGNSCHDNTFGNYNYCNTFGYNSSLNIFGNNCYDNSFGNNCYDNTFGYNCNSNGFANNSDTNAFGNSCDSNTFGYNCQNNTFGNNCHANKFGEECSDNVLANECNNNIFDSDCHYLKGVYDETNETAAHSYHVLSSTHGLSDNELYELPTKLDTNQSVTYVGLNSTGNTITWVPADDHMPIQQDPSGR